MQAVNHDSFYPEHSSMSGVAPQFLSTLPSNGSVPATLVPRSSNITIRPCKSNIDEEDVAKATKRSQRARKAANKRHRQHKKNTGANKEMEEVEKRRESNRVAAAKCRQKQLRARDALCERHQELCSSNRTIRRDLCELREQLLFLRWLALQHVGCECGALREYNVSQASRVLSTAYQNSDVGLVPPEQIAQTCIFLPQPPMVQ